MRNRIQICCAAWLMLAVLVGCGKRDPFDYVDASGKLAYDDGSLIPAKTIEIHFVPQGGALDQKTHPRPGLGYVNVADGTYKNVTSMKPGIPRGRHKVVIHTFDETPKEVPLVPKEYTDVTTTPLEVDTEKQSAPFNLTVPKPKTS